MKVHGDGITCRETQECERIVKWMYAHESENWHREVHKRGGTMQENVFSTLESMSAESRMFEVLFDGELAAFFVCYENEEGKRFLEGFHVAKRFRQADFLQIFWQLVRERMGGEFFTGIYCKNQEAIKHLVKQGFEWVNEGETKEGKFYIFKL